MWIKLVDENLLPCAIFDTKQLMKLSDSSLDWHREVLDS